MEPEFGPFGLRDLMLCNLECVGERYLVRFLVHSATTPFGFRRAHDETSGRDLAPGTFAFRSHLHVRACHFGVGGDIRGWRMLRMRMVSRVLTRTGQECSA